MTNRDDGGRVWQLVIALLVVLIGIVGFLVEREFRAIDSRLDRISDFVLEKQHTGDEQ